jgi:hypothetical protein
LDHRREKGGIVVKKKRRKIHEAVMEVIASTSSPCLESSLIGRLENEWEPHAIRKAVNELVERGLVERHPYHDAFFPDFVLSSRFAPLFFFPENIGERKEGSW